jgi:hypothetical protein
MRRPFRRRQVGTRRSVLGDRVEPDGQERTIGEILAVLTGTHTPAT